ncbi:MAG: hypothetical protein JWM19_2191 [Actinomycetia bacterium]|nr:hypothetical protein [Actinomycetes bacterium]
MEVKEAPARGLRAVFAGFGRALGGRRKGASAPAAEAKPAGDSGHVKVVVPEAAGAETVTPETVTPETTAAETAAPVAVAEDTATPEAEPQAAPAEAVLAKTVLAKTVPAKTVPAKTVPAETATPAAEAADALPLANYDTLTVASLRARLRTLSVPQLRILFDYEKAHQEREEVTGMFERRIAKIAAGETTSFPVVS